MMKRPSKPSDQQEIEEGIKILYETMDLNQQIEPTLWASAFWSVLIQGYNRCGFSYQHFCNEIESVKNHYKHHFDQ